MADVLERGGIQDGQVGAVAALEAEGGVEEPAGSCRGGGEGVPVRQPGLREEDELAVQRVALEESGIAGVGAGQNGNAGVGCFPNRIETRRLVFVLSVDSGPDLIWQTRGVAVCSEEDRIRNGPEQVFFQEPRALNQVRQLGVDGESWNPSGALLPHRRERRVGEWSRRGMRDGVGTRRHDLMRRRTSLDVDHRREAVGLGGLNACLHRGTVH
ncbi:hypothetical protein GGP88_003240 [Salinibacter ruber]|nr:hypothetical protein [Salinibacter ruber]MCS3785663.1 hypothetical protein [Salinibacter ruber]